MNAVELIRDGDELLAYLIRTDWTPDKTEFVTPPTSNFQLGMIVYGGGQHIKPHVHMPSVREVTGTNEVIIVRKGSCDLDIYTRERRLLSSHLLRTGDIVLLVAGGHGFRMREDTVLFEVKQGPYLGLADKEQF